MTVKQMAITAGSVLIAISCATAQPMNQERNHQFSRRDGNFANQNRAQQRPGKGMEGRGQMLERIINNPKLVEELGITEEQIENIKEEIFNLKKQEITLRADLEHLALEQAKLMTDNDVNEKALLSVVRKMGDIRTELACLQVKRIILLKQTLTSEQLEKIHKLMRQRGERKDNQKKGKKQQQQRRGHKENVETPEE